MAALDSQPPPMVHHAQHGRARGLTSMAALDSQPRHARPQRQPTSTRPASNTAKPIDMAALDSQPQPIPHRARHGRASDTANPPSGGSLSSSAGYERNELNERSPSARPPSGVVSRSDGSPRRPGRASDTANLRRWFTTPSMAALRSSQPLRWITTPASSASETANLRRWFTTPSMAALRSSQPLPMDHHAGQLHLRHSQPIPMDHHARQGRPQEQSAAPDGSPRQPRRFSETAKPTGQHSPRGCTGGSEPC
jgi:hypothetical protein